jgi:hypothetical protein
MGFEVFSRGVQSQTDLVGDDAFAAGLFGETVEQHGRHVMVVHIDDQIG